MPFDLSPFSAGGLSGIIIAGTNGAGKFTLYQTLDFLKVTTH